MWLSFLALLRIIGSEFRSGQHKARYQIPVLARSLYGEPQI
jgi:hypothetical protein